MNRAVLGDRAGGRRPDEFADRARQIREGVCPYCGGGLMEAEVVVPYGEPPMPMPKMMRDGVGWPCLACEKCEMAYRLAMRPNELRPESGKQTPAIVTYGAAAWRLRPTT